MWLFVGLGNPGRRYRETPHNAGFQVCDRFIERARLGAQSRKFQGVFARGRFEGEDVAVLKPETYMNLSGESVAEAVRYLPVVPENIVVVFDDMDLPEGKLRLRKSGGHGGHNGIRSIIDGLGTSEFPRLRVGVGRPPGGRDATGHLLSTVREGERERFSKTVDRAADALETIVRDGFEAAMNRFNAMPALGNGEETQA
jgi:PTH1 family peptidyl-tRNA hydrolase